MNKAGFFKLSALLSLCILILTGCFTENRHRVIFYDEAWSSTAGVKNLVCSAEIRDSCAQMARNGETAFASQLALEFHSAAECSTVDFKVLSPANQGDRGSEFWRLRVNFHNGFSKQSYELGPNGGSTMVGGEDADNVAFICKAAKQNGVLDFW